MSGVIFDLDGTLVDSLGDIGTSMNIALAAHGAPGHDLGSYRSFIGEGLDELLVRASPKDADAAFRERVKEVYRAEYAARLVETTKPYDGVLRALDELGARGLPLGVLTNKPEWATMRLVNALFGTRFMAVLGQKEGGPRKPDPSGALAIAALMHLEPTKIAFVGDTATDMETAKRAGMFAVGVLWGFRGEAELRGSGANMIVRTPSELVASVAQFAGRSNT